MGYSKRSVSPASCIYVFVFFFFPTRSCLLLFAQFNIIPTPTDRSRAETEPWGSTLILVHSETESNRQSEEGVLLLCPVCWVLSAVVVVVLPSPQRGSTSGRDKKTLNFFVDPIHPCFVSTPPVWCHHRSPCQVRSSFNTKNLHPLKFFGTNYLEFNKCWIHFCCGNKVYIQVGPAR